MELKYWYIQRGSVYGTVFGSDKFKDGTFISTSNIEKIEYCSNDMIKFHTLNSVYECNVKKGLYHLFDEKSSEMLFGYDKYASMYNHIYHTSLCPHDGREKVLLVMDKDMKKYLVSATILSRGQEYYRESLQGISEMFTFDVIVDTNEITFCEYTVYREPKDGADLYFHPDSINGSDIYVYNIGSKDINVSLEGKVISVKPFEIKEIVRTR